MPVLTIAGADIAYAQAGSGVPPVVLVHGGLCSGGDWAALTPLLGGRHAVIVPDLRAHGASGGDPGELTVPRLAADLVALLRHLDAGPALLVGHSLGARVVAQAACDAPALVASVVLLDGSRAIGGHAADGPEPLAPVSLAQAIDATIGPFADAAVRAQVAVTMRAASPELAAACVRAFEAWDLADADRSYRALADLPLLAIQSTYHDRVTPRRSLTAADADTPFLRFLTEAAPHAQVRLLPDTGHFAMLERPREVAGLIVDFLASLERPT